MSVLIKGMDMPYRGHTVTITIVGSGEAYVEYYDWLPHVEEKIEYKAIPIPPHGRLIDADECEPYFYDHLDDLGMVAAQNAINDMPTIIPAEPSEEEK